MDRTLRYTATAASGFCDSGANTPTCLGPYEPDISAKQSVTAFKASRLAADARFRGMSMKPRQFQTAQTLTMHKTKIKQMIMQAITLTTTSQAITSITPSTTSHRTHVLTASAFDSLFTICPAVLPYKSAAALRFALGDTDSADEDHLPQGREVRDQRWQIFGLLSERSTIKQAIRNSV